MALPTRKGRILYCIAWEYLSADPRDPYKEGVARAGFDYTHARSQAHAMHNFRSNLQRDELYRVRIAWCAPVIGYKVMDKQGLILAV